MREIDPKKVPAMMLSGELRCGMELEFFKGGQWNPGEFIGIDPRTNEFYSTPEGWSNAARFPLPKLRDGDPVIVHGCTHRHFHSFQPGGINCYPDGTTNWTGHVTGKAIMLFTKWRLPNKQELEGVLSAEQISELESRGCVG